jgi:hypothetical protein
LKKKTKTKIKDIIRKKKCEKSTNMRKEEEKVEKTHKKTNK